MRWIDANLGPAGVAALCILATILLAVWAW